MKLAEPDHAKIKFVAEGRRYRVVGAWLGLVPIRWLHRAVDWLTRRGGNYVIVVRVTRARPEQFWVCGLFRHFPELSSVELADGRLAFLTWKAEM